MTVQEEIKWALEFLKAREGKDTIELSKFEVEIFKDIVQSLDGLYWVNSNADIWSKQMLIDARSGGIKY